MDNVGYSLSDLRAATEGADGNGLGGNGILLLIVIFIVLFGANGFGYGNRGNGGGEAVTESALCNSQNFMQLENSVGRLSDQNWQTQMQISRAICDLGYAQQAQANETQRTIFQGDAAITQQLRDCCCSVERGIDSINYNGAINTNTIVQAQQAGTQRILDYLCGQENQRLRDESMRGYIREQFCGVVRYPQQTTWGAGPSPFFNGYGNCGTCGTCGCGTQF